MSKEMNKLRLKVTKYDIMSGLFMSLIIGLILSFKLAIVFLLGIIISMLNFRVSSMAYEKVLENEKKGFLISTLLRIAIIIGIAFALRNDYELIISYLAGFITHFPVLIYCTLKKEGSA